MTIHQATQQLVLQLIPLYEKREAGNIADLVMENITGWKRIDRLVNKLHPLTHVQASLLELYTTQLLRHRPVQYVLGEAWFYGMKLYVNEHVLIPRPETEELVDWAVHDVRNRKGEDNINLIDIGTGSGCIALAMKKELPSAYVYACDVSEDVLQVAGKNASTHELAVTFLLVDVLQQVQSHQLPDVDLIISNPPYIPDADHAAMQLNVLQYEPHLALFVRDDDPLVFYKAIAGYAHTHLCKTGAVYLEIHEGMASRITELFQHCGFQNIENRTDLQGKDRMVKVIKDW